MYRKQMSQQLLVLFLVLLVMTGCTPAAGNEAAADPAPAAVVEQETEVVILTPEQVTETFYNWYLDLFADRGSGEFVNPLGAGLYRDSAYLSADFVAQIDAELEVENRPGGGDPLLLAQDVPVRIQVQEANISGNEATVVMLRYWGGNPEPSPMVVHLRQKNGRWLINNVTPFEIPATSAAVPQPLLPTVEMDPVAVTQAFYDWYLAYIGERSSGNFRNPLVDKAYHDHPLLTPEFSSQVDETSAGFDRGGYDPFLQAQDIPQQVYAQSAMITGDQARVTVLRNWGPPMMDAIFAHLRRVDGVWLIDDVTGVELVESTTETPEGTVQMFYVWYTAALRRQFADDAIKADFHDSDLLTADFKEHLDQVEAAAKAEFPKIGLDYDPLLCAQDVPYHVTPDQALITGETAALTARTSFPHQVLTIDLRATDGGWQISNVTCADSPAAIAKAFYTWYLGYIGDRAAGTFRNPLVDQAYHDHPLLAESLIKQVDETVAGFEGGGFDPFLLAQDIPQNFSVDPGVMAGTAVVHLQFGPNSVQHLLVTMDGTGQKIAAIAEDEGLSGMALPTGSADSDSDAARPVLLSSEYGFSISYPVGWVLMAEQMDRPGSASPGC